MSSLNVQPSSSPLESATDHLDLEVETPKTNVIDLKAELKFRNKGAADTLQLEALSDALRYYPEPVRRQIASALLFRDGPFPKKLEVQLIEVTPVEPNEPDPVSQATAA
jgi:hypothetical protein